MILIQNYIGGQFLAPNNGKYFDDINPSTGELLAHIPDSDEADIEAAVQAAQLAFPAWSKMKTVDRFKIMMRVSDMIEAQLEALATDESDDNGKPLWLAKSVDIPRASSNFRFYATAAMQFSSESHPMANHVINYTLRQPLGVVACISPWNLPLYLFTWKIAPALAAGNTVVAKPSEVTPLTAFRLAEICKAAGMPDGVLNIVHGKGPSVGEPLVIHPQVKAVSFTGGTATGARIAGLIAPKFKKMSLELGGKNPTIIFADCNYEKMLKTTVRSSFANQGQICLCGSRIFVERSLYARFKKDFVAKVKDLKVSFPKDDGVDIGALVSESHMNKVLSYIELAKVEGGDVIAGGHQVKLAAPYDKGFYVAPTIVENLDSNCRVNQEEIFGPVVTIIPFDTEDDLLTMSNSVRYGLSATVWTENLNRAHRMAEELHAGIVWINTWLLRDLRTPFGGMKDSGVGREGGMEAMRFFTETKNVCIKY